MDSAAGDGGADVVVLRLSDPDFHETSLSLSVSTSQVQSWDLSLILRSSSLSIRATRSRLIEQSSYFSALLGGSFSESGLGIVTIEWDKGIFVQLIQFIFYCQLDIRPDNFLLLLEAGLFFGVEKLLNECENWLIKLSFKKGIFDHSVYLQFIIDLWNFGKEKGIGFIQESCTGYIARNFVHVISSDIFTKIPYNLLFCSIENPDLTIDSEKQLCEALVKWILENSVSGNYQSDLLKKVKICLLPLGFAAGLRKNFSDFRNEAVHTILNYTPNFLNSVREDNFDCFQIRLTDYTERVALSSCSHITEEILFLSIIRSDIDIKLKKQIIHSLSNPTKNSALNCLKTLESFKITILPFQSVREVDLSSCPNLNPKFTIECLHLAFPNLEIFRASHCSQFKVQDLNFLVLKFPLIREVDLTLDFNPKLISNGEKTLNSDVRESWNLFPYGAEITKPVLSGISRLTLEGRDEVNGESILKIWNLADTLIYLNIKGCTGLTDLAISKFIVRCKSIRSLLLSHTWFGRESVLSLCSINDNLTNNNDNNNNNNNNIQKNPECFDIIASGLHELCIDGCKGIGEESIAKLLAHTYKLKMLNLRETNLTDYALCKFIGSSLESLDISDTSVSSAALNALIRRNPNLTNLKATGCSKFANSQLLNELRANCKFLEQLGFGWGFTSYFSSVQIINEFSPVFSKVREITLGLGSSPGHHFLYYIPIICPLLESLTLRFQVISIQSLSSVYRTSTGTILYRTIPFIFQLFFVYQVISDDIISKILKSLSQLKVLKLSCCLSELTASCFKIHVPGLTVLRLEWVCQWMGNDDLALLTQNFCNLVELSLSGCKLLDSYSEEIISSGWPGLTVLHLEECGSITSNGISFLFNCKGIEDLLLRHNGSGLPRNFIQIAHSKLPLLRILALDLCDSCEGGFNSPIRSEMRMVRMSRCETKRGQLGN